jgi:hypothetical protein
MPLFKLPRALCLPGTIVRPYCWTESRWRIDFARAMTVYSGLLNIASSEGIQSEIGSLGATCFAEVRFIISPDVSSADSEGSTGQQLCVDWDDVVLSEKQ